MLSRWQWFTAYDARKLEWMTSLQVTGAGLFLGLPLESMGHTPAFRAAGDVMPEWGWAWVFGTLGVSMIHAMHLTNNAGWPAFLRGGLFLAAMIAYLVFGAAIIKTVPQSFGAYQFFSIAIFMCGASFIASCRDAGRVIAGWRGRA